MLPQNLSAIEARVIGSLIEKELSTPDHYPLSLNSLTSACNQSSNRDPVMALDESAVSAAVDTLRRQSLVRSFQASGSRVPKLQHLLAESGEVSRAELAVLCVLLLRGQQTIAEIRSRAARLLPNESGEAVEPALDALSSRTVPAVTRLARRPGQKEARYAHLLSGDVAQEAEDTRSDPHSPLSLVSVGAPTADRITALEELTQELRNEVSDLRAQLASFRKQFE